MGSDSAEAAVRVDDLVVTRTAIVVVDVVESVRLMEADEAGFITAWRTLVSRIRGEVLPAFGGRLVKSLGDGLLLRFERIVDAVPAALAMHSMAGSLQLRAAVHAADVVEDELDIYGAGVNLAARLCTLARPGALVVSAAVRDALIDGVHGHVSDLGECYLKHLDRPVRAFQLRPLVDGPRASVLAPSPPDHLQVTVAVLPFDAAAVGPQAIALGNAIADAIGGRMARLPGVSLISRLSSVSMVREPDTMQACRRYLGAAYVVAGTCLLGPGTAQGVAQLLDTASGQVVWSDGFRLDLLDLFAGQASGVADLVNGIAGALTRTAVQRARRLPVPNLDSFTLYTGGVALLHRLGHDDFGRARELLGAVAERHPRAASPSAMLAKWHLLRLVQGWSDDPRAEGRAALGCAQRALDVEPEHALALSMAALQSVHVGADLVSARALAQRAIDGDPHEPTAWMTLGAIHSYLAEGQASVHACEQAIRLSPLDPCRFLFDLMLGAGLLSAGRVDDALASLRASARLNAMHSPTYRLLSIAAVRAGHLDAAHAAAERLLALDPGFRIHQFVERYPGRDQPHAPHYADALRAAGLPE